MIDRSEILRYLGTKSEEGISHIIDECIAEANTLSPKCVTAEFDVFHRDDGIVTSNGVVLTGELAKNSLDGCEKIIILAATLTRESEIMLVTASTTIKKAVLNATFSAAIESYLDGVENRLKDEYAKRGYYLTPRFSAGYGDLPLSLQSALLRATDAEKLLDIHLTDSLMLTPVKSVTAIIGVSAKPRNAAAHHCSQCDKQCIYRKL